MSKDKEINQKVDLSSPAPKTEYKVKFKYKLLMFTGGVLALSWFFEGCRKIQEAFTLEHVGLLLLGTLLSVFFLGVMSYWVYLEEKMKGTLKKRIGLFEKVYELTRK